MGLVDSPAWHHVAASLQAGGEGWGVGACVGAEIAERNVSVSGYSFLLSKGR